MFLLYKIVELEYNVKDVILLVGSQFVLFHIWSLRAGSIILFGFDSWLLSSNVILGKLPNFSKFHFSYLQNRGGIYLTKLL